TDTQIIFSYFFILIISILIIFSPYIFYKSKNKSLASDNALIGDQLSLIDRRSKELQDQIKEYGALAMQLKNINTIFNNHLYWSQFLPTLENHTTGQVYFTHLAVTNDGKIALDGLALNLRAAAEELIVFENSKVYTNVRLGSLNFVEVKNPGDPAISFSLGFEIPRSVILSADSSAASAAIQK
ncbi:MAG TPA: hypothetical protein P5267_00925, partial [Patescibacteria group bacterium]|nr:hypothetical protein [Patescibacteria group bacterium]